jgi:hypothetical protein
MFSAGILYKYSKGATPPIIFLIAAIYCGAVAILVPFIVAEPINSQLIKSSIRKDHSHGSFVDKPLSEKLFLTMAIVW